MDIKEAGNKFNKEKVLTAIFDTINKNKLVRKERIIYHIEKHRYKIVGCFFNRRVLKTDDEVIEWLEHNDNWDYYDARHYKTRTEEYLLELHKYVSMANYGEDFVYLTPDQFKLIANYYTN